MAVKPQILIVDDEEAPARLETLLARGAMTDEARGREALDKTAAACAPRSSSPTSSCPRWTASSCCARCSRRCRGAGDHPHRAGHRRDRGGRDAAGRLRLPDQAGGRGAAPAARSRRRSSRREALREVALLRRRVKAGLGHRPAGGHQRGHAGGLPPDRAGRADHRAGADHGRERHRQGAGGARRSTICRRGAKRPVRGRQLRGHPGDAARERALRPREGRLHRRAGAARAAASSSRTAARSSSTRSPR